MQLTFLPNSQFLNLIWNQKQNFAMIHLLAFCFPFRPDIWPVFTWSIHVYVTDGNIMYLTDASRFLISCVIQHYAPVVGWERWRNRCIMLIITLDPSWIQTLSLPPPGIEPGSPASQAGTLPKELTRQLIPVLRIRDVYPRSRILIFSHPGSWIQNSNKREG
jgi:hypothetical protein